MTSVVFLHARLARAGPAQDVLVAADRVSAVGTIGDLSGADEVVDLDGRFLLRGLWDHHVHFEQWAQVRARLDVSGADSARGAAHLVADHIARHDAGGDPTVVGYGFRGALWADAPQRELLDAVCPDIPVALISADLHSVWLNTVALGRFGHAGHATGLLREEVAMRVIEDLGRVPMMSPTRGASRRPVPRLGAASSALLTWRSRGRSQRGGGGSSPATVPSASSAQCGRSDLTRRLRSTSTQQRSSRERAGCSPSDP